MPILFGWPMCCFTCLVFSNGLHMCSYGFLMCSYGLSLFPYRFLFVPIRLLCFPMGFLYFPMACLWLFYVVHSALRCCSNLLMFSCSWRICSYKCVMFPCGFPIFSDGLLMFSDEVRHAVPPFLLLVDTWSAW